jgi:hypothetical protein
MAPRPRKKEIALAFEDGIEKQAHQVDDLSPLLPIRNARLTLRWFQKEKKCS